MLGQLPVIEDPNLLIGINTADDCAVYRINDRQALVQTVDFFTPVVDDPFRYGEIAAANSLSDIYAMGCTPLMALNIIGFPKELPLEILARILEGGASKAREAGISIVGGHTVDDREPKYGLVVTAIANIDDVVANAGARVGDDLVLTKPLGSGILISAIKRDRLDAGGIEKITDLMATLNRDAADAMKTVSAHACTDITGFGLLGHLREMTSASGVGAEVYLDQIPILDEVWPLATGENIPGGTRANLAFLDQTLRWDPTLTEQQKLVLCDAQTSGGLLIAVDSRETAKLMKALQERQTPAAHRIGRIIEDPAGAIHVLRTARRS